MRIAHIALWTQNLEEMRVFYETYFGGKSNEKYTNPGKGFESYFISFESEVSLEIMRSIHIHEEPPIEPHIGLCHLAFYLKDSEAVVELTERLRREGYEIVGEPRTSGDGYFESVILDPDSNRIELVAENK